MKIISRILLCVALLSSVTLVHAQVKLSVSYNPGMPLLDMRSYINNMSFRGAALSLEYQFQNRLTVGATYRYQSFWNRSDREQIIEDNTVISAVITRTSTTNFFSAYMGYSYPISKVVSVFGKLNLGISKSATFDYFGILYTDRSGIGMELAPEVGFLFHILKPLDLFVGVRYSHTFGFTNKEIFPNLGILQPFIGLRLNLENNTN